MSDKKHGYKASRKSKGKKGSSKKEKAHSKKTRKKLQYRVRPHTKEPEVRGPPLGNVPPLSALDEQRKNARLEEKSLENPPTKESAFPHHTKVGVINVAENDLSNSEQLARDSLPDRPAPGSIQVQEGSQSPQNQDKKIEVIIVKVENQLGSQYEHPLQVKAARASWIKEHLSLAAGIFSLAAAILTAITAYCVRDGSKPIVMPPSITVTAISTWTVSPLPSETPEPPPLPSETATPSPSATGISTYTQLPFGRSVDLLPIQGEEKEEPTQPKPSASSTPTSTSLASDTPTQITQTTTPSVTLTLTASTTMTTTATYPPSLTPTPSPTTTVISTIATSTSTHAQPTFISSQTATPTQTTTAVITPSPTSTIVLPTFTITFTPPSIPTLPTKSPSLTPEWRPTEKPLEHHISVTGETSCKDWEVFVETTPTAAEITFDPSQSGKWKDKNFIKVIVTTRWADGVVKTGEIKLMKLTNCDDD